MNLLDLLIESSSLRDDLKQKVERALKDIICNIDIQDELVARVSDETYEFLKEVKNEL